MCPPGGVELSGRAPTLVLHASVCGKAHSALGDCPGQHGCQRLAVPPVTAADGLGAPAYAAPAELLRSPAQAALPTTAQNGLQPLLMRHEENSSERGHAVPSDTAKSDAARFESGPTGLQGPLPPPGSPLSLSCPATLRAASPSSAGLGTGACAKGQLRKRVLPPSAPSTRPRSSQGTSLRSFQPWTLAQEETPKPGQLGRGAVLNPGIPQPSLWPQSSGRA